jgi:hypothetical protein
MIFRHILFLLFIPVFSIGQKHEPFTGKLVYSVQMADTALQSLYPATQMVVYTNDTITRIENETDQLGKQVTIKHLTLNKSYLLIETPDQNFAIQTDLNEMGKKESKYTFKKKFFKRKIAGLRANKLLISHPDMKIDREYLYFKKFSPKYINTFEEFPGLPVHYYIITMDGIYEYTLKSIEFYLPPKDLFGIPSDFKKVTLDEFMEYILQQSGGQSE